MLAQRSNAGQIDALEIDQAAYEQAVILKTLPGLIAYFAFMLV
jgi:hypothetical protein